MVRVNIQTRRSSNRRSKEFGSEGFGAVRQQPKGCERHCGGPGWESLP